MFHEEGAQPGPTQGETFEARMHASIQPGINRKYMEKYCFYINSLTFFGFCVLLALGVFYIGQKDGGRRTKILPGRQTHFGEFF